jgi:hypothetical protein
MQLDPHWREKLAASKVATPPVHPSVLSENDLHPDPARLQAAIRQLEIRVKDLEATFANLDVLRSFLND